MPRFVILTHNHPFLHWDLMLEGEQALRTWRLPQEPYPGVELAAEPLPDHRLRYLDYEGPVSNGRGEVRRWDCGVYSLLTHSAGDMERLEIQLDGKTVRGVAVLESGSPGTPWTLRWEEV